MTDVVVAGEGALVSAGFDQLHDFTATWLKNRRLSANTRLAYARDIRVWLEWCEEEGLNPLRDVRFTHVNAWARDLEHPPDGTRGLTATSVARKMSAVSSWYAYLLKLGAVAANPAAIADRPLVDRDYTATVAFDHDDAARMLLVAAEQPDRLGDAAPILATWLVDLGTRSTETCALDVRQLTHHRGHRVVDMVVKGGKRIRRTIPPELAHLIDQYIAARAARAGVPVEEFDGPLFVDAEGHRLDMYAVFRFVKRLARKAGLPNADRITPHSFRHAWNTMARANGAELEDRQEALGHADPRTTRRYDRTGRAVERDPSLLVARALARREPYDPAPKPGQTDYWPRDVEDTDGEQ